MLALDDFDRRVALPFGITVSAIAGWLLALAAQVFLIRAARNVDLEAQLRLNGLAISAGILAQIPFVAAWAIGLV